MKPAPHALAGGLAILLVTTFWVLTVVSEALGDAALVTLVKSWIPWGFLLLVPAMATVGGTGSALAAGREGGVIEKKKSRMKLIAANGLLILIPAALFLRMKAQAGAFDAAFYGVQALELIAGGANLTLLVRNALDGRRMTAHKRRRSRQGA